jgi:uncharacterized SAM-binding protein YcdF (DUF218 family)
MMGMGRLFQAIGAAGVLAFLVCGFTPAPNLAVRMVAPRAHLGSAGAIVVLGFGLQMDGELTPASFRLAVHGIQLYHGGLAPLLVFSGMAPGDTPSEPEIRAALARQLRVPADAVLTHDRAKTTREESVQIAARLRTLGVHRILLVADSIHMVRAGRLFAREGLEVLPAPVDGVDMLADQPEGRLMMVRRLAKELVALLYYGAAGYL